MLFYKKSILLILSTILFNACDSDSPSIIKSDNKITLFPSSQIKKELYLNGIGQIIQIETFNDGKLNQIWIPDKTMLEDSIEYYGNGQIKTKGYLVYYTSDIQKEHPKKHSLWEYFDRDGHLLIERYFSYDKPTTIWIWYDHDNHEISKYELYENYRDHGTLKRYYRSSNIKEEKKYFESQLTGDYTLFYDSIHPDSNLPKIQLKGQYGAADSLGKKIGHWDKFKK